MSCPDIKELQFSVQKLNIDFYRATLSWNINPFSYNIDYETVAICKVESNSYKYSFKLQRDNITKIYNLHIELMSSLQNISNCATIYSIYNDSDKIHHGMITNLMLSIPKKLSLNNFTKHKCSSKLVVICKLKLYTKASNEKISQDLEKMSKDFENLLVSERLSDCVLKSKEAQFKVHKAVLSARSSVFAAMFKYGTKECHEGIINIEDIDADVLRSMIDYIYKGKVKDIDTKGHDLFNVAEKYGLDELRTMCEEVVCKNLTIKNVIDNLLMADVYNNENIKKASFIFIKNNFNSVLLRFVYKQLQTSYPHLLQGLMDTLVHHKDF